MRRLNFIILLILPFSLKLVVKRKNKSGKGDLSCSSCSFFLIFLLVLILHKGQQEYQEKGMGKAKQN